MFPFLSASYTMGSAVNMVVGRVVRADRAAPAEAWWAGVG